MINKKYLKLLRTKDRKYGKNFIYNEISKNIIDSLDILKVPFNNILELGINDKLIINYLKERFPTCSIKSADIDLSIFTKKTDRQLIEIDLDDLQIKDKKFDLIYSNFFCQLTSDFEKLIKNIFQSLNSNGFFIATIPSAENIYQLINSMYEDEFKPLVKKNKVIPGYFVSKYGKIISTRRKQPSEIKIIINNYRQIFLF